MFDGLKICSSVICYPYMHVELNSYLSRVYIIYLVVEFGEAYLDDKSTL